MKKEYASETNCMDVDKLVLTYKNLYRAGYLWYISDCLQMNNSCNLRINVYRFLQIYTDLNEPQQERRNYLDWNKTRDPII